MHNPRRAATVVAVIMLLVIIDLVIVGLVLSGTRNQVLAIRRTETVKAFYAAEAGMNMALREVMLDEEQDGDCGVGTISHDGDSDNDPGFGNARWLVTTSTVGYETTVKSHGRSGEAQRQMVAVVDVSTNEIVFDNATSDTSTEATLSFNHAIGGDGNRLLVICIALEASDGSEDVTGVTYDGTAMVKAVDNAVGGGTKMNTEIWYMLEADLPATGTYEVAITTVGANDLEAGAISVSGAAQQAPEATALNDDGEAGDESITTQITTSTGNAWVFECVGSGNAVAGFSPDSGQVERFDEARGSNRGAGSTQEIHTAGTVDQGWTAESSSNRLSHVLAAFAPG